MKLLRPILLLTAVGLTAAALAQATDKPVLEIVGFKVGTDHYPMLDRRSSVTTADNPDYPWLREERAQRLGGRRREVNERAEELKSHGKLQSDIKVIDQTQWVQVTVRKAGTKTIRSVEWDFAFPRYAGDKLLLRYDAPQDDERAVLLPRPDCGLWQASVSRSTP